LTALKIPADFWSCGSLGIGVSKLMNVILNNLYGVKFDKTIIEDMKLKLIANFRLCQAPLIFRLKEGVYR